MLNAYCSYYQWLLVKLMKDFYLVLTVPTMALLEYVDGFTFH